MGAGQSLMGFTGGQCPVVGPAKSLQRPKLLWQVWHLAWAPVPLLMIAPHALAREDHPDLIQNAKKSDIPEKPKTPQQLWYTHEKKVYLKVRPDVSVRQGWGGGEHG